MISRSSRTTGRCMLAFAAVLAGCGTRSDTESSKTAPTRDSSVVLTADQRARIHTATVALATYSPTILSTGTVEFNGDQSTQIISAISGPVVRVLVNPGDVVVPGQLLALVASPDFAAAIAGYRKSETELRNAQRIASLDEKLFANDALARTELDQAKSNLASAEDDRDAAAQELKSLGVDDASITAMRDGKPAPGAVAAIRSPIAGTVVERAINPGQLLQAGGTTAFTIADLSSVWVMGNVFAEDMAAVRKGSRVTIETDVSADTLEGTVDYVGALVDRESKATPVRIVVSNRGHILRQNMLVNIAFRGSQPRTGILIPVTAVLRDDENLPFVYVKIPNTDHFLHRRITLGGRTDDRYEVREGLKPGEVVVIEGALYLQATGSR